MTTDEGATPVAAVRAKAREGVARVRKTATEVITVTRETGEAVIDDTREKTYRAAAETNRLFQEHPIAAVAAAAAAGAIIGIFMPRVAIAGKAGKIAGRAIKAAATSETAKIVVADLNDRRKAAMRSAAGKAASVVGERIRTQTKKLAPGKTDANES
jgi:ElaB/YqjD/DUF883 family membrane-anchored ribosome-binding protein